MDKILKIGNRKINVKTEFLKIYKVKGMQRQNMCAVKITTVRNKFKYILLIVRLRKNQR